MNTLLVLVTITAALCGEALADRKADALAELRNLDSQTSEDSLVCVFKWGKEARAACRKEKDELKKTLMKRVQQYWMVDKYITPEEGSCVQGYASFNIGSFDDPVRLPCDEQAFVPPKHTDAEIDAMYKDLLKTYNAYDQICFTEECRKGKDARGLALAEKIKYAEDEEMIPRKCQKGGTGWYSFYSGMQEVECPCIYTDPSDSDSDSSTSTTAASQTDSETTTTS